MKVICKFSDGRNDWYLEWSSVVDAPTTRGMSLEEFKEHYRQQYGEHSVLHELPARLERVEAKGTSSFLFASLDDLIRTNRAGDDEKRLTKAGIIRKYCKPAASRRKADEGAM